MSAGRRDPAGTAAAWSWNLSILSCYVLVIAVMLVTGRELAHAPLPALPGALANDHVPPDWALPQGNYLVLRVARVHRCRAAAATAHHARLHGGLAQVEPAPCPGRVKLAVNGRYLEELGRRNAREYPGWVSGSHHELYGPPEMTAQLEVRSVSTAGPLARGILGLLAASTLTLLLAALSLETLARNTGTQEDEPWKRTKTTAANRPTRSPSPNG